MCFKIQIFIIFVLITSCKQKEPSLLGGPWLTNQSNYLRELFFLKDSVRIIDDWGYETKVPYEIVDNELSIHISEEKNISTQITKVSKDSFLLDEYIRYFLQEGEFNDGFTSYDLLGVASNDYLEIDKNFDFLHIYKLENGILGIRCNDQLIKPKGIQLFLSYSSLKKNEVALFLGKGLKLRDLKRIYYQLYAMNRRRVTLVLHKEAISKYHIFEDFISILAQDFEQHFKLDEAVSRSIYYEKKVLGKKVILEKKSDDKKLEFLEKEESYLFLISDAISVEDYIKMRIRIKEKRAQLQIRYRVVIENGRHG